MSNFLFVIYTLNNIHINSINISVLLISNMLLIYGTYRMIEIDDYLLLTFVASAFSFVYVGVVAVATRCTPWQRGLLNEPASSGPLLRARLERLRPCLPAPGTVYLPRRRTPSWLQAPVTFTPGAATKSPEVLRRP